MAMQHPDDKHLQFYVAARLDDAKVKIIEKHLAKCPQCTKRVSELEQSLQDPLLQKVKAAANSADDSSGTVAAVVRSSPWNKSVSNVILPGDILGGNLRLEEKLGRGGMGETWKAYDQTAERFVVLKFVPGEMQHMKEAMDSVRSSFQKIHALQHQHICPVYSLVDDPKCGLYVVMKYIDGMTLSEYRRRLADKKTKLSFNDIVQILWAVAKGLDYAHEQKVIHRDIKPGNIMIGRKDGVQVIDFGLAEEIRTIMSQASDSFSMSSSGTRPYMAPEQWQGRIQDARTDQYALAVTAYELFSGHVPFSGNDIELLKNTVLNDSPEAIASLPDHANAALLRALSKKRDERYENCKAFVKALAIKTETTEVNEIAERKIPDEKMSVSDLPSDQGLGEKVPPLWLPDGFSSMPKPPIIVNDTVSKKKQLPPWVMPTFSALAMLVVCLIGFLGYMVLDRHPKPEKPIAVAKITESKFEPVVETVPVQEEKAEQKIEKPIENEQGNIEPENAVEEEPHPMDMTPNGVDLEPPLENQQEHPAAFQSQFKNIFEAANEGSVQDVEYFVKNGADLNAIGDKDGNTPLHEAAKYNVDVEVLKYLVSKGADPNVKTNSDWTLLHHAAKFNPNVDVVKYLVSIGAAVNVKTNNGWTPLHHAAWKNSNVEVMRYLLSQQADLDVKNRDGQTPLDVANTDEKKAILREAMIPAEAKELRRQFEEAVKQAQTPYREELEKELTLLKKQNKPELVASLESELKYLSSEDSTELSVFAPEKRSLFNVKVRYKKQMETARDNYLKGMDSLAKELVRNARIDDALIVQKTLEHVRSRLNERNNPSEQKLSLVIPKRSQLAPVPVLRMTIELHADGKGRFGASRGMSTDVLDPVFPSTPFSLSAFPKAQAFRGANGMGRVVFDFRNADSQTTWNASGWNPSFNTTKIDLERRTLCFETSKLDSNQIGPRASFWPGKFFDLPVRITVETVINSKGYSPIVYFMLTTGQGERSYVCMWRQGLAEKSLRSQYRRFLSDNKWADTSLPKIEIGDTQPVWTPFELPGKALENVTGVHCVVEAGNEFFTSPQRLDYDVEVVLMDISGKLRATTGLTVAKTDGNVTIKSISPKTAAFRAGLKQGDEIARFNGEKRSAEDIQMILYAAQFGDPFTVAVIRNGEEKVVRFFAE